MSSSFNFSTNTDTTTTSAWWNSSWTRRIKLTFDNSAQAENLVNFPVLVVLNSSRIDYTKTESSGQDLRFIASDGTTVLSYEIEKWNTSGNSYIWVRVPQINASSSTSSVYMYYGNTSASTGQSVASTWNSGYQGVWHLGSTLADSTSNSLTPSGSSTVVTGTLGDAHSFNGSTQSLNLPNSTAALSGISGLTLSAWVKLSPAGGAGSLISFSTHNGGVPTNSYRAALQTDGSNNLQISARSADTDGVTSVVTSGGALTQNIWIHVAATVTYASNSIIAYINGVSVSTSGAVSFGQSTTNSNYPAASAIAADPIGTSNYLKGSLDEIRVSGVARSSAWISAEYKTQIDSLITYGSVESQ